VRAAIRKLGNSSGVIIPKSMLTEIGSAVGDTVDLSLEVVVSRLHPSNGDPGAAGLKRRGQLPRPEMTRWFGRNSATSAMTN
jgi:hypothetical protein